MARPNQGKTNNSTVVKIWIDKKFADRMAQAMKNLREELILRENKQAMSRTLANDWKIKIAYEPDRKK